MNKNSLKSVGAVFGGFIAVLLLSIVTDILLQRTGVFPPQTEQTSYVWWMLLLALFYRSTYGAVGGFLAAHLAPNRPTRHAIILGILGVVVALLGSIANWDKTSPSTAWYPILLILFAYPSVWFGGRIKSRQLEMK